MIYKNFFKINNIFLLIPILLITGGFLPGIAFMIILSYFLINLKFDKKKFVIFLYKKINIFIIFTLIYLIIHSLFSNYKYESLSATLFYFRYYLFVLAIFYSINFNEEFYKYFFYILLSIFIIFFLDSMIQFYFKKNIFFFNIEQPGRISSFFRDELMLGSYIARFFPLLFALIFIQNFNKFYEKLLLCFFVLLSSIMIILSGERNAIILFLLSFFLLIILMKDYRLLFTNLLFFFVILFIFFYYFNSSFQNRMFEFYNIIYNHDSVIYETYYQIFFSCLQLIKSNFIFGVGTGLFELNCKEIFTNNLSSVHADTYCRNHPHNFYLQFFSENGIIGFIFIFCIFLYFTKELINYFLKGLSKTITNNEKFIICMLIAIYINIWPISQHTDFFSNYISNLHFFILSIYIKVNYLNKNF